MKTEAENTIIYGLKCSNCKKLFIPPKYVCSSCDSTSFESFNYSGKGRIHTYTIIRIPPESQKDQAPYVVAVVQLEEGPFITGRLLDWEEGRVEIGAQVVFAGKNENCYWFKLRQAV